jgi:hypothetical protein
MSRRPTVLLSFLLLLIKFSSAIENEPPVSVHPAKFEFSADEYIEINVTNVGVDPVYLIPTFSSYPYDYFYPPDNYLERFDGEYWRPLQYIKNITYYDKRLLFFELATGDTHTLKCSLSDFGVVETENTEGEYRAAINVIIGSEKPVVTWNDFEEFGQGHQVTIKSGAFKVAVKEEDDGK